MQTLNLLGSGWKLKSHDGKHVVEDAALPGQALQILHDAGLVEDPLHGCVRVHVLVLSVEGVAAKWPRPWSQPANASAMLQIPHSTRAC